MITVPYLPADDERLVVRFDLPSETAVTVELSSRPPALDVRDPAGARLHRLRLTRPLEAGDAEATLHRSALEVSLPADAIRLPGARLGRGPRRPPVLQPR